MTFSPGMMQTAANEAGAMEEKAKGTGGLCVCVCVMFECVFVCVCRFCSRGLWDFRAEYLSQLDRSST